MKGQRIVPFTLSESPPTVQYWLTLRQKVLVAYYSAARIPPFDIPYESDAELFEEFCSLLNSYCTQTRLLIKEISTNNTLSNAIQKNMRPFYQEIDDFLMHYYHHPVSKNPILPTKARFSTLGEGLTSLIELEDQLLISTASPTATH